MAQLPVDTVISIFYFLQKRDLFQACYVNMQWHSLIFERHETWIHLAFVISSEQAFPEQAIKFMEACKISKIDFAVEKDENVVVFEKILLFSWLAELCLTRNLFLNFDTEEDVLVLKNVPDHMNLNALEICTDKCYDAGLQLLQANSHSLEKVDLSITWDYEVEEEKIQQYKEAIFSIKKLKSLSSRYSLFRNDEEFDSFASVGHLLEELTISDEKGFSKTSWNKLFSSSVLKKLIIEHEGRSENGYVTHAKDKFVKIKEQPTLEELSVTSIFPYCIDIIRSAVNLKKLRVRKLKNENLTGLCLPYLQSLDLIKSDASSLLDMFNACGDRLKRVKLRQIEGTIVATPKKKFGNLQAIDSISECDFSVVEYVLKSLGSTKLDDVTISDIDGTPDNTSPIYRSLFSSLKQITRVHLSLNMFLAFPEAVLPTIRYLTFNSGDIIVDDDLVNRLIKCSSLVFLNMDEAKLITAYDWISRLLTAIPPLEALCVGKGALESTIDTSKIVEETKLNSLHVDLTPLDIDQLITLILKSPHLVRFGSDTIACSFEHLSALYSLIDSMKTNITSYYIYLQDPPESSARLSYLNRKMNHISIIFGVKYSLEAMALIATASCDGTGSTHYFEIDGEMIDWLSKMTLSYDGSELKQKIVEVLPSIVEQLDNLDEAKKQDIISRHSNPENLPEYMTDLVNELMRNYIRFI